MERFFSLEVEHWQVILSQKICQQHDLEIIGLNGASFASDERKICFGNF